MSSSTGNQTSDDNMSSGLTWKILSHMASNKSEMPPFYCQRSGGTTEQNNELFLMASPIYGDQAIYSLHSIKNEFMHVLRTYSDGKMSAADIGIYLGMNEHDVKTVGESLCTQQDVIMIQSGYALKSLMMKQLAHCINMHCSNTKQPSDLHPTLESMVNNPTTHCPLSSGGVTVQQLSTEVGLTMVDATYLLGELFDERSDCQLDSNIVLVKEESTGQLLEVTNPRLLNFRRTYLERQVLSALVASTVPVSVSIKISTQCDCFDVHSELT